MFQNAVLLWKPSWIIPIDINCSGMIIGEVLYKFYVFYADLKSKMAATAGHRLTLDHMRKCSNAFFSETTNIKLSPAITVHFECSLDRSSTNFTFVEFRSNEHSKCTAMAGLSLTFGPYGKNAFQNASSLKPLGPIVNQTVLQ